MEKSTKTKNLLLASSAVTAILGINALTQANTVKATTDKQQDNSAEEQDSTSEKHVSRVSDRYDEPNQLRSVLEQDTNSDIESAKIIDDEKQINDSDKSRLFEPVQDQQILPEAELKIKEGIASNDTILSAKINNDVIQTFTANLPIKVSNLVANTVQATNSITDNDYSEQPLQEPTYDGEIIPENLIKPNNVLKTLSVFPNITKIVMPQTNKTQLIDSNNAASTKDTELEAPLATYPPVNRVDGLYSGSRNFTLYIPGSSSVIINGIDMWTADGKITTGWNSSLVQKVKGYGFKDLYTVSTTLPNTIDYIAAPENVGKFINFKVSYVNTAGGKAYESPIYSQRLDSKSVYKTKNEAKKNIDSLIYLSPAEKEEVKTTIQTTEIIIDGSYNESETINAIKSVVENSELNNVINEINVKNISIDEINNGIKK